MRLIRGGAVVRAGGVERADVLVNEGRIVAVAPDIDADVAEVFDAGGALVIPGAIDVHTHLDLQVGAVSSADDFASGTRAAACGGTTCIVDFAGAGRESPEEALEIWHEKSRGATIDYGFHLTVTSLPDDDEAAVELFRWFLAQGVASVKLYMAYPERLMVDDATLARALRASARTGVLVCVHAEDGGEVEQRTSALLAEGRTGPSALPASRPPSVEADAIRRAVELAAEAGAPVYIVHLSSGAGLQAVREARAAGVDVLAETCPQYLFLTDDLLRATDPAEAADHVCTPPIRGVFDQGALWAGLADGAVRTVATDHCPFTRRDRAMGTAGQGSGWRDLTEIPGGLPGVETRLALVYQGVLSGSFDVSRWVELVATEPARLFGLSHVKGDVRPGLDADVVVFDPTATKRLNAGELHMATDHSPYEGMEITGWPALVLSRGRVVAVRGEPHDIAPNWGRFVPRTARVI